MKTLLAGALRRIHLRHAVLLLVGDVILAALLGAWLQIPDSHAWQFVFSVLCAVVLAAAFLYLHASILRSIRGTTVKLWVTIASLVPWMLLWWKLYDWTQLISVGAWQRAGYWNSQLSPAMRHFFTYGRLQNWQLDAISIITWLLLPALLLPFVLETATQGPRSRSWLDALKTLISWQHWTTITFFSLAGYWLPTWIMSWHPQTSAWVEVINLIVRAMLSGLILAAVVLLFTAIESELLHRRHATASDPTPDDL